MKPEFCNKNVYLFYGVYLEVFIRRNKSLTEQDVMSLVSLFKNWPAVSTVNLLQLFHLQHPA